MTKQEEILELKTRIRELQGKLSAKINTTVIRACNIEKGKNYVFFFGRDSGLTLEDIARIDDPLLRGSMFVLENFSELTIHTKEEIKAWTKND